MLEKSDEWWQIFAHDFKIGAIMAGGMTAAGMVAEKALEPTQGPPQAIDPTQTPAQETAQETGEIDYTDAIAAVDEILASGEGTIAQLEEDLAGDPELIKALGPVIKKYKEKEASLSEDEIQAAEKRISETRQTIKDLKVEQAKEGFVNEETNNRIRRLETLAKAEESRIFGARKINPYKDVIDDSGQEPPGGGTSPGSPPAESVIPDLGLMAMPELRALAEKEGVVEEIKGPKSKQKLIAAIEAKRLEQGAESEILPAPKTTEVVDDKLTPDSILQGISKRVKAEIKMADSDGNVTTEKVNAKAELEDLNSRNEIFNKILDCMAG
jgi:hypothetical protein